MAPLFAVTFVPLFVTGHGLSNVFRSINVCGIACSARKMIGAPGDSAESDPAGSNCSMSVRVVCYIESERKEEAKKRLEQRLEKRKNT